MNLKFWIFLAFFALPFTGFSQSKAEKRAKAEQLKAEITKLMESGNFSMILVYDPPKDLYAGTSVNTASEQYKVRIQNDSIFGELPFQGSSTQSGYHSSSGGFLFKDPIKIGEIKTKKRGYLLEIIVNQPGEMFDIAVEISFSGDVFMNVKSNRRSTTTFRGIIQP